MSDRATSDTATPPGRRFLTGQSFILVAILLQCILFLKQSTTLLRQYHAQDFLGTTVFDSIQAASEIASSASPLMRIADEMNNYTRPMHSVDSSTNAALLSLTSQTPKRNDTTTNTISPSVSFLSPPLIKHPSIYQCTLPNGDRVEMMTAIFPKLIIAGTQKGGTTSLRTILAAHPNLTQSLKMEPHFFDRHCQKAINMTGEESSWCALRWNYYQRFPPPPGAGRSMNEVRMNAEYYWTFEKTPSYMLLEYVPAMIQKFYEPLAQKPKIVMMLRDPVDRAFSHYKHEVVRKIIQSTFETMIAIDVELLRDMGMTQAPPFQEDTNVHFWTELSSSAFALSKDTAAWQEQPWKPSQKYIAQKGKLHAFVARGLYAYQIHQWTPYFPLNMELLVLNYDSYQSHKQIVLNQMLNFIGFPNYTFPQSLLEEDHSPVNKTREERSQSSIVMKNATQVYLQRFFAPYNALLEEILGTEWKNVWQ